MGLKAQEKYTVCLQNIDDESYYYRSILWVDDDDFNDETMTPTEIIALILSKQPDYIALDDLRYVRQDVYIKQVETGAYDQSLEELENGN